MIAEKEIILDFKGQINFETIGVLLNKYNNKTNTLKINEQVAKRVYSIIVECLENIYFHCSIPEKENLGNIKYISEFSLQKDDKEFIIISQNLINNNIIGKLKEKIDLVNSLDKKGLKELYKKFIMGSEYTERGSVGLGIIDIAKTSGNTINYKFEPVDNNNSYYTMQVTVSI
ncbi:MAG: SiaB family protein kinase [Bacteroidales bacterium]|nr:SiaB family protein kinase [Bacteroidales bacterium]